jgi:hypothetical protein
MTDAGKFWTRVQEEGKAAFGRTKRAANRAVRQGVLQVDLVSLRRDRTRAMASLGERALRLWSEGNIAVFEADAEAQRLRTWIESIEGAIAAKETEAAALRERGAEQQAPGGPA